jgi:hypothetical protein
MKSLKHKLFYTKCLWISYFFQIFTYIGSSVICLSLSEIPIWTHQREFGLFRHLDLHCVMPLPIVKMIVVYGKLVWKCFRETIMDEDDIQANFSNLPDFHLSGTI